MLFQRIRHGRQLETVRVGCQFINVPLAAGLAATLLSYTCSGYYFSRIVGCKANLVAIDVVKSFLEML